MASTPHRGSVPSGPSEHLADRPSGAPGSGLTSLLAACLFASILFGVMLLRPVRESLAIELFSRDGTGRLFQCTLVASLLAAYLIARAATKLPRSLLFAGFYGGTACALFAFRLAMLSGDLSAQINVAGVYYVFHSAMNVAAVSLFWALLADGLDLRAARARFGPIAIGGTIGAMSGPLAAQSLASRLEPESFLVAGGFAFLVAAVLSVVLDARLRMNRHARADGGSNPPNTAGAIGGSAFDGFIRTIRSRYLIGIALLFVAVAFFSTHFYFLQQDMIRAANLAEADRVQLLARIDLGTQVATILLQAFATKFVLERVGVGWALALLPIFAISALVWSTFDPRVITVAIGYAVYKSIQRAVMRPARETLFVTVERTDRYKAKSFIDTFVYRGGDVLGERASGRAGDIFSAGGVLGILAGIAALWIVLAAWLGVEQRRRADVSDAARSAGRTATNV